MAVQIWRTREPQAAPPKDVWLAEHEPASPRYRAIVRAEEVLAELPLQEPRMPEPPVAGSFAVEAVAEFSPFAIEPSPLDALEPLAQYELPELPTLASDPWGSLRPLAAWEAGAHPPRMAGDTAPWDHVTTEVRRMPVPPTTISSAPPIPLIAAQSPAPTICAVEASDPDPVETEPSPTESHLAAAPIAEQPNSEGTPTASGPAKSLVTTQQDAPAASSIPAPDIGRPNLPPPGDLARLAEASPPKEPLESQPLVPHDAGTDLPPPPDDVFLVAPAETASPGMATERLVATPEDGLADPALLPQASGRGGLPPAAGGRLADADRPPANAFAIDTLPDALPNLLPPPTAEPSALGSQSVVRLPESDAHAADQVIDAKPTPLDVAENAPDVADPPTVAQAKPAPNIRVLRKPRRSSETQRPPRAELYPRNVVSAAQALNGTEAEAWGQEVVLAAQFLADASSLDSAKVDEALDRLRVLESQATGVASGLSHRTSSRVLGLGYALRRRLAVLYGARSVSTPDAEAWLARLPLDTDGESLLQAMAAARAALGPSAAVPWGQYLRWSDLERLARSEPEVGERLMVATDVLNRLSSSEMTQAQRQVVGHISFLNFQKELRRWVTQPVDAADVVHLVEQFEQRPSGALAEALGLQIDRLRWSLQPQQAEWGRLLDGHYRNANLRVAMTQRFVDRMLPVIQDSQAPIRDQILGARVFGNSASWTEIGVRFVPDPHRIHVQLQAGGVVAADTRAFKGPVVTFNRNHSEFFLSKPIIVSDEGVSIGRSITRASGTSNLLGMRTEYDRFPIIGLFVRRAAQQEFFEQRHLARRIFERRVANNAESKIDNSVTEQLAAAQHHLDTKIMVPLRELGLQPAAVDMQTTEERITFRGRLAGFDQLAGYTARPRALADNLFSLQVHESSVNNVLDKLDINGRAGNLRALMDEVAASWKNIDAQMLDEVPDNVHIELASRDALRVELLDNAVRFTLKIKKLALRRRQWQYFAVRASYVPRTRGFQIELGRDGVVELDGRRLSFSDQVALRGIFTKVFSKNRNIRLIDGKIAADPRLSDLAFSQLVMRDGWIGVSVDDAAVRAARLEARRR